MPKTVKECMQGKALPLTKSIGDVLKKFPKKEKSK